MTYEEVQNITKEFYAGDDAKKKEILEKHKEVLKGSNKAARKLLRVGMPMSVRFDMWTDEVPVLAGTKRVVLYVGSAISFVGGSIRLFKWIF